MINPKQLLWIDGLAGLSVGILVVALHSWLASLYGLPPRLLLFTGIVNILYGCYSTPLAFRQQRPMAMIRFLVFANVSWTLVCFVLSGLHWSHAGILGLVHLIGEGIFVGTLAAQEWKWKEALLER
jgi:hypothetical protein